MSFRVNDRQQLSLNDSLAERITNEGIVLFAVDQYDGAQCIAGNGDGVELDPAKVKYIAIINAFIVQFIGFDNVAPAILKMCFVKNVSPENIIHPPLTGERYRQQPFVTFVQIDFIKESGSAYMIRVAMCILTYISQSAIIY